MSAAPRNSHSHPCPSPAPPPPATGGLFLSSASRLVDRHGADVRSAVAKALPSNFGETTGAAFSWAEEKLSSVTQDLSRMMGLDASASAAPKPSAPPSRRSKKVEEVTVDLDADVGEDVPLVDAEDDDAAQKLPTAAATAPDAEATPAPAVEVTPASVEAMPAPAVESAPEVETPAVEPAPVDVPTPESAPAALETPAEDSAAAPASDAVASDESAAAPLEPAPAVQEEL